MTIHWTTCLINRRRVYLLDAGSISSHLSPVTCHLSPIEISCHLSPIAHWDLLSPVTCHLSPVTCHLSPIAHWDLQSPVTCRLSPIEIRYNYVITNISIFRKYRYACEEPQTYPRIDTKTVNSNVWINNLHTATAPLHAFKGLLKLQLSSKLSRVWL